MCSIVILCPASYVRVFLLHYSCFFFSLLLPNSLLLLFFIQVKFLSWKIQVLVFQSWCNFKEFGSCLIFSTCFVGKTMLPATVRLNENTFIKPSGSIWHAPNINWFLASFAGHLFVGPSLRSSFHNHSRPLIPGAFILTTLLCYFFLFLLSLDCKALKGQEPFAYFFIFHKIQNPYYIVIFKVSKMNICC